MNRREVYKFVAAHSHGVETLAVFFQSVAAAMRFSRGLAADISPCVQELLDSHLVDLLKRDDALGEIYQAINAPALERAYRATTRDRRKFSADEIPAVTQLFTPRFVVELLLHNTLGKLWVDSHPQSQLPSQLKYLLPPRRAGFSPHVLARDIKILDPACGTMNFGLVAIDLLDAIYREELATLGPDRASVRSPDQIPAAIIEHNLFGIDIDPVALDLAAHSLSMKLAIPVERCRANLWRGDALFDRELESRCVGRFDIVATNPPYLSSRNLPAARVAQIKRHYPHSWRDACACFIERSLQFAREGGYVGILAMQSFMFTGAFEKLRTSLAERAAIDAIAHFGPGLFDVGNPGTLQTAAIVLRRESDALRRTDNEIIALRLVDQADKAAALQDVLRTANSISLSLVPKGEGRGEGSFRGDNPKSPIQNPKSNTPSPQPSPCVQGEGAMSPLIFTVTQHDLLSSPRGAWVYWLTPQLRRAFECFPKLQTIAPPRQGLATTDNARFVRYWWEVTPTRGDVPYRASSDTWFPYVKSGRFRRWYESPRHRVNWADDGRAIKQSIAERYPYLNGRWEWVAKNAQFYGRGGVTYSYLTSGAFSARLMPAGAIFDVAGSALFPDDALTMLAILNASVTRQLLHSVNPTVNFQVGDLAQLPIPSASDERLSALASEAVELQRQLDTFDETAPDFVSPPPWDGELCESLARQLEEIGRQIDTAVAELYGVIDRIARAPARVIATDKIELAQRWISFAIGRLLGRWGCDRALASLTLRPSCPKIIARIRDELARLTSSRIADEIEQRVGGIASFLAANFYACHVKRYHRRPIYWAIGGRENAALFLHDQATPDAIGAALRSAGGRLPRGWRRCADDGMLVNFAPLAEWVADKMLAKYLNGIAADLRAGRFDWSQTADSLRGATSVRNRGCGSSSVGREAASRARKAART